jgi:hypothetical protein
MSAIGTKRTFDGRELMSAFGVMEQETEGTSVYEVDDAKCKDGQYDIKLDKDFQIIAITRD